MINISVYGNIEKVDYDIIEGEYPGETEKLREAITQLFQGKFGEWVIIGEYENYHIKVKEFYQYDWLAGELIEKSFEELYLNQTGGWFGIDIDKVFTF